MTATFLLLAGGLGALQAATLIAALPFCFIMLMLALGLVRQTNADLAGVTLPNDAPAIGQRLKRLIVPARRADILRQIERKGEPALRSVYGGLQKQGWGDSGLEVGGDSVTLVLPAEAGRALPIGWRRARDRWPPILRWKHRNPAQQGMVPRRSGQPRSAVPRRHRLHRGAGRQRCNDPARTMADGVNRHSVVRSVQTRLIHHKPMMQWPTISVL